MRALAAILAVAIAAGVAGVGRTAESGDTPAQWLRKPTAQEYVDFWPQAAAKKGAGGKAVLDCEVDVDGVLEDCKVASESPANMGFGAAALSMSPKLLFKPASKNGHPVASRIQFGINFRLDNGAFGESAGVEAATGTLLKLTDPGILVTHQVAWRRAPTRAEVDAAYPASAKPETGSGHVVLACRFKANGLLRDCSTQSEQPKGQGFGAAARSLAADFQMDADTVKPGDLAKLQINLAVHLIAPSLRSATRTLDHPDWLSANAPDDSFPAKAAAAGLTTGRGQLDCVADFRGRLNDCRVLSEDPSGEDFGSGALRVASAMIVNPWTEAGEPADGAHIVFGVRINKPEPAATAAPSGH